MTQLVVEQIVKQYAGVAVLRGVSLSAARSTIVALLGPSGCGKTTLLRIIAGLERADSGQVSFDGQVVDDIPVHRRGFGMMFQDYALFPHRDVAANIAFGLRMQSSPSAVTAARVAEMLDLVQLRGYEQRRVYELSGGERQRVALARALAPRPRLLMLDEPLAALDRTLREQLQHELHHILRQVGVTSLYVTHDQEEAFALADEIVLMRAGSVVQSGPPEAVYRAPVDAWAARFLGLPNLVAGEIVASGRVATALGTLVVADGTLPPPGTPVSLLLYPDAVQRKAAASESTTISGVVAAQQFRGRFYRLWLHHPAAGELVFDLDRPVGTPGDAVTLALRTDRLRVLPREA